MVHEALLPSRSKPSRTMFDEFLVVKSPVLCPFFSFQERVLYKCLETLIFKVDEVSFVFHAFVLSLMIKISQSASENFTGYCKNRIFPFLFFKLDVIFMVRLFLSAQNFIMKTRY